MSTAMVRRPTEDAAVYAVSRSPRRLPPAVHVADLLIVARATGDRYGQRQFSLMLDRVLGGGS